MKRVEILAPVGNMECLYAAIEAGCDAVYLGGYLFGARNFALNFSMEELKQAISLSHLYQVKVYVTVNTLIYEDEVETFMNYVDELVNMDVDALIIQDIGMLDLVRQTYPSLELHASTQMHIHNRKGVELASKLGCSRVVLSRETDIDAIKEIRKNTPLELEIFVHGALCVSYSGQCLMSSLIGGRSGNRGTCAGTCRLPYTLVKKENNNWVPVIENSYLLSMKDLNTVEHLGELIEAGVDSLKIEGRMKRPSYVYAVVSLYRKAVDQYYSTGKIKITEQEQIELKKIFNRGYTKGFLFHEKNNQITNDNRPNHIGIEVGKVIKVNGTFATIKLNNHVSIHDGIRILGTPDIGTVLNVFKVENQIVKEADCGDIITLKLKEPVKVGSKVLKTTDQQQLDEIDKKIASKLRKVPIEINIKCKIDSPLVITLKVGNLSVTKESTVNVMKALNRPITKEDIIAKITRLGNTVYECKNCLIEMDDNCFIPIKELNDVRRLAIEALDQIRTKKRSYQKGIYKRDVPEFDIQQKKSIYVSKEEQLKQIDKSLFDHIYVSKNLYSKLSNTSNIIKRLPRVMMYHKTENDPLLVSELGSVHAYLNQVSDYSLNVVNSYTLALLHSLGVSMVTLSYELSIEQIKKLLDAYKKRYNKHPNTELIIYAKEEMMTSKFLLPLKYGVEEDEVYLKDRYNHYYLVTIENGYMVIYHDQARLLTDTKLYYELGINSLRIMLSPIDDYDKVKKLLQS